MTVTVTTVPTYPVAGREFKFLAAATEGNFVRIRLTSCPPESTDWYSRLRSGSVGNILLGEVDSNKDFLLTCPVGGVYTFLLEEFTRGASSYGGSYAEDPDSYDTLTPISTATPTLKIGQRLTVTLGSGANTATLVLCVWDTYCRPTTEQYHGEATPKVTEWTSEKAKVAALDTWVTSTATGMGNETCANIVGSTTVAAQIDNLIDKHNAHLTQASVHASNDTDNAIDASFKVGASGSVERMSAALGEIESKQRRHMTNDSGSGPGSATTDYHTSADNKRAPVSDGAVDMRTVIAKLADLRRIHTVHIGEPTTIHANADTTNTVTAGSPLLVIHQYFFTQLATTAPTVPATEQTGVVTLVAGGGFEKA